MSDTSATSGPPDPAAGPVVPATAGTARRTVLGVAAAALVAGATTLVRTGEPGSPLRRLIASPRPPTASSGGAGTATGAAAAPPAATAVTSAPTGAAPVAATTAGTAGTAGATGLASSATASAAVTAPTAAAVTAPTAAAVTAPSAAAAAAATATPSTTPTAAPTSAVVAGAPGGTSLVAPATAVLPADDTAPGVPVQPQAGTADDTGRDLLHLLRRATYGPTPASLADARTQGWSAWLAAQLAPASVPDPVGDRIDALHPGLFLPVAEARVRYDDQFWVLTKELVRWRLARSVWSTRQLHEVMTDLMHNHLNVPVGPDGPSGFTLHLYHHDVVRAHALGSFSDMLAASAEHPAMLHYLNANTSTRQSPNENYARELLELHTVGVGAHTEADVRAAALLLTGWRTWWPWEDEARAFTAWFDPSRHHVGAVTVLGRTYANDAADGRATIRTFLADLARHPATARHVCRKLARHLVADEPPEDLVDDLARVYLDSGTRLGPVLLALFRSEAFDLARGTKVRRPLERYLATVRLVAPAPVAEEHLTRDDLIWRLPSHRPLSWLAPDGYPDTAVDWESAGVALAGLNTASELLSNWAPVVGRQLIDAVLATDARDVDDVTAEVSRRVLLRAPQPNETDAARLLLARSTVPPGPWPAASWDRYRAVWYVATLLLSHPALLDR